MSNEKPTDPRSASQKITDLENAALSLIQTTQNLLRDVVTLKETVKLLNNKVSAVAKAATTGELPTDDVLTRIMIDNNIAELEQKVQEMVIAGNLTSQDEVTEQSFIVGSEENAEGKTVNPRIQFSLAAFKENQPELAAKFVGAKPGDTVDVGDGKFKFRLAKSYLIQEGKAPEAEAPAPEPAPEATPPEATTAPASVPVDTTPEAAPEAPAAAPTEASATPAGPAVQ